MRIRIQIHSFNGMNNTEKAWNLTIIPEIDEQKRKWVELKWRYGVVERSGFKNLSFVGKLKSYTI